jgi:sugar phosphate isomerase/epimerase
MTVKIGIQTRSLRQPLRQALVTASRLGAEGIEIDARHELRPSDLSRTGLGEFHKLLSDLNLRVSAVAFPTRRGYDDPDDLERRVLATQEAMRFAADLRADVIINDIGRIAEKPEDPSFQRLIEALTAIAAFGERAGVRLAAQTTHVSPQDLARVLAALPSHSTGIDLHPSGLIDAGHSPIEAIESLGPNVLRRRPRPVHPSDHRSRTRPRLRRLPRTPRSPLRIQLSRLGHDRTPRKPQPNPRYRKRRSLSPLHLAPNL